MDSCLFMGLYWVTFMTCTINNQNYRASFNSKAHSDLSVSISVCHNELKFHPISRKGSASSVAAKMQNFPKCHDTLNEIRLYKGIVPF